MADLILPAQMSKAQAKAKYEELLQHFARNIKEQMPPGVTFALVTFTADGATYAGYVSPAPKNFVINALRTCADRLEKKKFWQGNSDIILPN